MTDHLFPADQADSLVDGALGDVPHHLGGLADVLAAAHQPATSGELRGMSAIVQQFAAAVTTPTETTRSTPMFGTRLTRRTAAIIVATLLTGGTAAAAAGALPTPFTHTGGGSDTPVVDPIITEAPETSEATETIEAVEATETIETTETIEAVEATETIEATETPLVDTQADEQEQVGQNDDSDDDQNDDADANDEQEQVGQNDDADDADADQNDQQEQVGHNDDAGQGHNG